MELILNKMTKERAEEIGIDLLVQCIKVNYEEKPEDTFVTLSLNVLGVIYYATISKYEVDDFHNVQDCWKALIEQFGFCHMMGQSKRVQDGKRDLTADEKAILNHSTIEQK